MHHKISLKSLGLDTQISKIPYSPLPLLLLQDRDLQGQRMNHVEYGETVLRTGESVHPHIVLVHFSIPVTITCAVSAS